MSDHITVVLANGGACHFHGDAMYDPDEGILVVHSIDSPAVAYFPAKDGYVVSWVTSPMTPEQEAAVIAAAKQNAEEGGNDGSLLT